MATDTVPFTQSDCETAPPTFKADENGKSIPLARLINMGGHLYLQVAPSKLDANDEFSVLRTWIFRACLDGKPITKGLGPLAYRNRPPNDKVLTLDDARLEARDLTKKVKAKINPAAQAKAEKKERERARNQPEPITFAEAAVAYADAHAVEWSRVNYRQRWLRVLEKHANPLIGDMPVADVAVSILFRSSSRCGSFRRTE